MRFVGACGEYDFRRFFHLRYCFHRPYGGGGAPRPICRDAKGSFYQEGQHVVLISLACLFACCRGGTSLSAPALGSLWSFISSLVLSGTNGHPG